MQHSKKFNLIATVAFGFVMTFSSGFGQTFFISLFNQDLREAFDLSHGQIGGLYFFGTIASALTIIWLGKLLDTIALKYYSMMVCIGLAAACLTISYVTGPITLAIAFFLLRLFGQGLSGHTGITTASRTPKAYRGRAISLSGLGFSCAEIALPLLTLYLITIFHWRELWQMFAVFQLIGILLITQFLLWSYGVATEELLSNVQQLTTRSWTRGQVARDPRFWYIAPAIFSPSIISTGLFFHQQNLAEFKQFSFSLWASAIVVYSLAAVTCSLISGFAVDKWSGIKVVRFYLIPFILATLLAAFADITLLPFVYYGLMGVTVGIATPAVSALWLELYGHQHIAAIRSLTHALMVLGSALGPVLFGTMLDAGYSWTFILVCCACWMAIGSLLLARTQLKALQEGEQLAA